MVYLVKKKIYLFIKIFFFFLTESRFVWEFRYRNKRYLEKTRQVRNGLEKELS